MTLESFIQNLSLSSLRELLNLCRPLPKTSQVRRAKKVRMKRKMARQEVKETKRKRKRKLLLQSSSVLEIKMALKDLEKL